ncbi:MAG: hypothetical protein RQ750_08590 [Roseovarius sp.]|nr:hypothetical protein [Roseovarius sp.]
MRVLLHPGFHKTGTSSLQRGAIAQTDALAPYLRVLLGTDMISATRAARRYSKHQSQVNLMRFSEHFHTAISALAPNDPRAVLISCEDLSGYMPGLCDVDTFDAAPSLMLAASAALQAHFGEAVQIMIRFGTRDSAKWLKSLYWQNLRARRLTDDFDTFRQRFARAADLDRIVASTGDLLGTEVDVGAIALETGAGLRLGPLEVALDLLNIPTASLPPLRAQNRQPADGAEALLALNCSDLDDAALKDAKRDLVRSYRRHLQP